MRIRLLGVFTLLLMAGMAQSQVNSFKVVGYYSLRIALENNEKVDFKRLTHINLWFLNPDSAGNFNENFAMLIPFIQKAHKKNVKVLFSIGGGSKQPQYRWLLQDDKRTDLVNKLITITDKYNLDGIDVDLEGSDIDDKYERFVIELAAGLKPKGKLITSAIAVYYKDQLTDQALAQYDFVNIMSYDRTGPWRPEKPGPHSALTHAEEDLKYFRERRGISPDKMTLGVPFYGYGFGPDASSPATSMSYNQIVKTYRGSEKADEWKTPDGKTIYYNGIPTMQKKVKLAREKAGGIMIWQIRGDAKGGKSLLKVIDKETRK